MLVSDVDPVGQTSWSLVMLVGGPGQDHKLIQRRENAGGPGKGPEGELEEGGSAGGVIRANLLEGVAWGTGVLRLCCQSSG